MNFFVYFCGMNFDDLLINRRSCRSFSDELIDEDRVAGLLSAALLSPTSMNRRAWHFVVVDDKADLEKLADIKEQGAAFLRSAPLAVVVMADPVETDCYVEDCAIAAITMQYEAESLGLGSCWVQVRGRNLSDGTSSADVVRGILDIPESMEIICVVAFGFPAKKSLPHNDDLKWEQVHIGKF
jgi:nitroreductase